jgi:Uma2 family endonuclease
MVKKRATYDDLLKLPENVIGEILDGELVATPRPTMLHAAAGTAITGDLYGAFGRPPGGTGGPGGWWILFEPELHLHGDVLVPDVAGWTRERMARIPSTPGCELSPDWVCEVLSPSTARIDRLKKQRIYARERVGHLWLVDPALRTLEVFRLEGEHWLLVATHADLEKARVEPFAALGLDLARWWGE